MELKQRIKALLSGHPFSQEYLCMAENSLMPLAFFLDNTEVVPHLFIGYKPVIIATKKKVINLTLIQKNGLDVVELGNIEFNDCNKSFKGLPDIFISTGNKCNSHLLKGFKSKISKWVYKKRSNKNDLLYLPYDLYNQVRLMYSIPRKISLIITGKDGLYNVCPTDLHGTLNEEHYIISLRKNGKLNDQVNEFKKLLLADVDASYYKEVYLLGKNHMQDIIKAENHTSLTSQKSELFKIPIPKKCIAYKELELIETIDIGVHNIHLFTIKNNQKIKNGNNLMHIHAYYAAWRKRLKYEDDLLIR